MIGYTSSGRSIDGNSVLIGSILFAGMVQLIISSIGTAINTKKAKEMGRPEYTVAHIVERRQNPQTGLWNEYPVKDTLLDYNPAEIDSGLYSRIIEENTLPLAQNFKLSFMEKITTDTLGQFRIYCVPWNESDKGRAECMKKHESVLYLDNEAHKVILTRIIKQYLESKGG